MLAEGKCVIVTGGGGGIGRAIAEAFAAEGARVYACDVDGDAVARIDHPAGGVHGFRTDIANSDDVDRLFDAALKHFDGRLDVLVNNAGVAGPTGPVEDMELQAWKDTFEVNVHSAFLCLRRAVPVMKAAGSGCIVNVSSTAGLMGYPLRAPYAAAKWGLIGLTKSLAMELGPAGIRVNAVCPGAIEGPRMERVIVNEAAALGVDEAEVRRGYLRQTSMRTFIDAREIADTVTFLCSDKAAKITGQALSVDGFCETLGTIG